jgi:hypothetical protein
VIPERRYEMSGRSPLIIMGLGAVAFLIVLIGIIVETAGGWEAGSSVALLGAVAVLGGGFLKMRDPVAFVPEAASVFAGTAMQAADVALTPPSTSVRTPGDTPGSSGARTTDVEPPAPGPSTSAQADPRSADTLVEPRAAAETPTDPPATSVADEMAKLAELREKDMLTDDEFAALKVKLMG